MQNSSLMHPMGHFRVNFFCKKWDLPYQHIYLGCSLKLKGVWANIILGDFISATPTNMDTNRTIIDHYLQRPLGRWKGESNTSHTYDVEGSCIVYADDPHYYIFSALRGLNSFITIGAFMRQLRNRASLSLHNFSKFCPLTTFDS